MKLLDAGLEIWRSRVQFPLLPLAGSVSASPWFNSSAARVYSRLVSLPPVGILVQFISVVCFIGPEKPQWGEDNQVYITLHKTDRLRICIDLVCL